MPTNDKLRAFITSLLARARASRQRRALVLSGDRAWCRQTALSILEGITPLSPLWVGDEVADGIAHCPAGKARKLLGGEHDCLVFDGFCGMDPEALGAVSGTLRGGGLFIWLTPTLDAWGDFDDPDQERISVYPYRPEQLSGRFLQRISGMIINSPAVYCWAQGDPLPQLDEGPAPAPASEPPDDIFRTTDQRAAVEAIEKVVSGHRRRPLVLTSDRGRGKSAALGIAAARLIAGGLKTILVTAPRADAVATLFVHAARHWPAAQGSAQHLYDEGSHIRFLPPDELTQTLPAADLVIVDEAAAIPSPLLTTLLAHYSRLVFATTVHGYEGNGRGFALRFKKTLDERTPDWHEQTLSTPIRWAEGDPLEAFIFRALLLKASPAEASHVAAASDEAVHIEELDRDRLLSDEPLLCELFGLLVLAHYQTSPMDLRHLLDGPNVRVFCMRYRGAVVATALLAEEGGFDEAMARQVWEGRRRPRGHLLPQSLSSHAGFKQAPRYRYARIMRIAVHPSVQGRGLGSALLNHIGDVMQQQGMDFIGASFGASAGLMDFWCNNQQWPVRVGFTRGSSSGTHAVMVLRPLTEKVQELYESMRRHFLQQLPMQLQSSLTDLSPAIALRCLRGGSAAPYAELNVHDGQDIEGFAHHLRGYEACEVALWKLLLQTLSGDKAVPGLSDDALGLLIKKLLQKHAWSELGQKGVSGRRQSIEQLRLAYQKLWAHYSSEIAPKP